MTPRDRNGGTGDGVIAIIPARAGSRRMAGKNMRPLAGRPMIGWTIDAALKARRVDRIVISTDDPAVLALAETLGCPAPFVRPKALSGPKSSVVEAVDHALKAVGGRWSWVVLLQPTSPLRTAGDIDAAIALAEQRDCPAVVSVSPLSKPAGFHVRVGGDGLMSDAAPELDCTRVVNGAVYVIRPDVLRRTRSFRPPGTLAYSMPVERGWDVDTADEFAACQARLERESGLYDGA